MVTEMVCEIFAMQEFPACVTAGGHWVVGGFSCKGLCDFQRWKFHQLRNMPAEENILRFRFRAVSPPVFACLGHYGSVSNG